MKPLLNSPISALLLTFCIALISCDSNQFYDPYPQTRILRVDIIPNPVAEGDTVTFICVIADSLDDRFEFTWSATSMLPDTTTKEPIFQWVAKKYPSGLTSVLFSVRANNHSRDSVSVINIFSVYIGD